VKYDLMIFMILAEVQIFVIMKIFEIIQNLIESCVHALFMNFYTKICFNQAFIANTPYCCMCHGDLGKFLCVEQREATPPHHPASCDVIEYVLL
jgi:hypothetical protein